MLACALLVWACLAVAQQNPPDAPSAVQQKSGQLPDAPRPQAQPYPRTVPTPSSEAPQTQAPPPSDVMPAVPRPANSGVDSRDEMFKIIVNVNQVFIPVTVRDDTGHLVEGLLRKDFSILENGWSSRSTSLPATPTP